MSQNLFSQMVNHFEGHAEITTKNKLFKNITKWHDENSVSVFKKTLPLTFCLKIPILSNGEVDTKILSAELKPFKQVFKLLSKHKNEIVSFTDSSKSQNVFGEPEEGTARQFKLKYDQPLVMPQCHFAGNNIWILKPTGLNRGKGIHVLDSIKEAKHLIKQTCQENRQFLH